MFESKNFEHRADSKGLQRVKKRQKFYHSFSEEDHSEMPHTC